MATVAQFDITYTQFLDEHGKLAGQLPDFAKDYTVLKELYKIMVLTRTFDKKQLRYKELERWELMLLLMAKKQFLQP